MLPWTRPERHKIGFGLALWFLMSFYIAANFAPWQLSAEVTSDAADMAQLFYSADGAWNEPESMARPLAAGANAVTFTLPLLLPGKTVRFDPGQRPTTYRIERLRWMHGGLTIGVPPELVHNPRDPVCRIASAHPMRVSCSDNDSQLIIPAPDPGWVVASFVTLFALPILTFMPFLWLAARLSPPRIAGVFLTLCGCIYVFITLFHGPILPLYDDWRYLYPGPFDLVDGDNWKWLTVVGNDTYFLTNQLIDFVVLKMSNVDFYWLRIVALALLILHLVLQYRILSRVAGTHGFIAGIAIALCLLSLASDGFWGTTAVAYQQFLPTFFATCTLTVLLRKNAFPPRTSPYIVLALFCAASGLAYISGGLMMLALGAAGIVYGSRESNANGLDLHRAGWWIAMLGAAFLLLQILLVNHHQGSLLQHNHAVASVFPTDHRFWIFFFALFGRAVGYTGTSAFVDMLFALLFVFPGLLFAYQHFFSRSRFDAADTNRIWRMLATYAGLGAVSYAAAVAFGRAGFIQPEASASAAVALAKMRFHYWPIAAMVPYVWLGWAEIAKPLQAGRAIRVVAALLLIAPKSTIAFAHEYFVSSVKDVSLTGAACVVEHLADVNSNRPVVCTSLTAAPLDIGPVIARLRTRQSPLYSELTRGQGRSLGAQTSNTVFYADFDR